ncbi:hypothetical protein NX862_12270 [Rhodobacter sp. KR11]|uniref:hypothetical protein n=1 Tax=Rhodobacter sp. KR11 TaxID=2974588 RepID=UPI002223C3F2|nr:hypothetical protein [Rhodobacter sp. KR11]MCW1919530.1 hypothetical protein [Rhodobacter sp. KR11]
MTPDFRPRIAPPPPPATRRDLRQWMEAASCDPGAYSFAGEPIAEGFILAQVGNSWHLIFTERGQESIISRHETEADLVEEVCRIVAADRWICGRLLATRSSEKEARALALAVKLRGLAVFVDHPPGLGHRVFVHGADLARCHDLNPNDAS